jgi:hypothetical protein
MFSASLASKSAKSEATMRLVMRLREPRGRPALPLAKRPSPWRGQAGHRGAVGGAVPDRAFLFEGVFGVVAHRTGLLGKQAPRVTNRFAVKPRCD